MDLLKIAGLYKVSRIEKICLDLIQDIVGRKKSQGLETDQIPDCKNLTDASIEIKREVLEEVIEVYDGKCFTWISNEIFHFDLVFNI